MGDERAHSHLSFEALEQNLNLGMRTTFGNFKQDKKRWENYLRLRRNIQSHDSF